MHDRDRRPTDDRRTEQPTDDEEPDPTDPEATEWDVPTDAPDRFGLTLDPIGGGELMHERGTDPSPTDDEGPPWIAAGRDDVIELGDAR